MAAVESHAPWKLTGGPCGPTGRSRRLGQCRLVDPPDRPVVPVLPAGPCAPVAPAGPASPCSPVVPFILADRRLPGPPEQPSRFLFGNIVRRIDGLIGRQGYVAAAIFGDRIAHCIGRGRKPRASEADRRTLRACWTCRASWASYALWTEWAGWAWCALRARGSAGALRTGSPLRRQNRPVGSLSGNIRRRIDSLISRQCDVAAAILKNRIANHIDSRRKPSAFEADRLVLMVPSDPSDPLRPLRPVRPLGLVRR